MTESAVSLLKSLIALPSVSRNEQVTADLLESFLRGHGVDVHRCFNNVWAYATDYDAAKPTLLLNSHHDTVKPSAAYRRDPYSPVVENGCLYGLGSNDAGASLVGLVHSFLALRGYDLPFNMLLVLSAEEEVTGERGLRAVVDLWSESGCFPQWGIIGEPTSMNVAIGERGLVVLDCKATARGGHAARTEGENALYKAIDDIQKLRNIKFPVESELLGPIKVTATQLSAGSQHNVLPSEADFVVDVRTTDALSNEQTVEFIRSQVNSTVTPRSTRIRASVISPDHPLVRAAVKSGAAVFVSPTTSDQSVLPMVQTIKIGIGESSRSHMPDEFVRISEIEAGIRQYINLIEIFADEIMGQGL